MTLAKEIDSSLLLAEVYHVSGDRVHALRCGVLTELAVALPGDARAALPRGAPRRSMPVPLHPVQRRHPPGLGVRRGAGARLFFRVDFTHSPSQERD